MLDNVGLLGGVVVLTLSQFQICINQQDVAEKSAQVALMGRIYQQCSRALIWLGCDASECNLHGRDDEEDKRRDEQNNPFALTRLFDKHISEWPCFAASEDGDSLVFEADTVFDGMWKGYVKVNESPWWTRIWTVQEALLPSLALLVYDTWSMTLQEVLDHGKSYFTHVSGCCAEVHLRFPETIMAALATQCVLYAQLQSDLELLANGAVLSLDLCHKHYGHRSCQDPRDKIYGMLGLIGNDSGEILPDYSEPLQLVFYRATRELLAGPFGGLQILRGFQYGPSSDKWASWVRAFDRQWTQSELQTDSAKWVIDQEFDAGGSSSTLLDHEKWFSWPCVPKDRPNQVALAVTGRCIATLETICPEICQPRLRIKRSMFKAWMQVADFDFEAHAAGRYTQTNERIWRTMVGGVILQGTEPRRFTSDDMALLDCFVSWLDCGDLPHALIPTISIPTASRTYFRTHSGGHGLCYPTCRPGDQVWVHHGSTVPFVLRPVDADVEIEANVLRPSQAYIKDSTGSIVGVEKDFEARTGHYQLVGDCYYDGFMDGEGLDDEKFAAQHILLV